MLCDKQFAVYIVFLVDAHIQLGVMDHPDMRPFPDFFATPEPYTTTDYERTFARSHVRGRSCGYLIEPTLLIYGWCEFLALPPVW